MKSEENQAAITAPLSERSSDYIRWEQFRKIEEEIIKKKGIKIWESSPPTSPEYLIQVMLEQRNRKTNQYEKRVLKAFEERGLFPDFQCIVFNRRVCDFGFLNERILMEIDDASHRETKEKDEFKDAFALEFGFRTFRLIHPYSEQSLRSFVEDVEREYFAREGIQFNYKPFVNTAAPKQQNKTFPSIRLQIQKLFYRVPNGKKLKRMALKEFRKLPREKIPEAFERLKGDLQNLKIVREKPNHPKKKELPKSKEYILRKKRHDELNEIFRKGLAKKREMERGYGQRNGAISRNLPITEKR